MADSSQHGAGPGQGGHGPLELFRWLNRPCRDMTSLISAAMDERLPWPQRTAYRLHLLYCTACRRYRRQLLLLRTALQRICAQLVTPDRGPGPSLSPAARARIAGRLARGA